MPLNLKDYPPDWKKISLRIRERDEWRCKFCGIEQSAIMPTGGKVVLTVAHLHDSDPYNIDDDNLAALCQSCHNSMDGPMRSQHAKKTRALRKHIVALANGQQELFMEEDI